MFYDTCDELCKTFTIAGWKLYYYVCVLDTNYSYRVQ